MIELNESINGNRSTTTDFMCTELGDFMCTELGDFIELMQDILAASR